MQLDPKHEFRLGKWHVKPLRGVIQSETETQRITPKAMDVLVCLARHRGEVVGRDIFLDEVWQGRMSPCLLKPSWMTRPRIHFGR